MVEILQERGLDVDRGLPSACTCPSLICLTLYYRDTVALSQVLSLLFGVHRTTGQTDAQRGHGLAGDTEC